MQAEIRYAPSFATIFARLQPGEVIVAESDAMASMSADTVITTHFNGGFVRGLARKFLGGESLFVNHFHCPPEAESVEVVLTQPTPGDIQQIDLKGETLILTPGTFIACAESVRFGVSWAGFASWWSGEGLFRLTVSGQGSVWFGAYGGVVQKEVDGEYIVDSGHVLAYEPTVRLKVGLAGGIFSSFFSGEGFVSRMRGRGRVYMQSRSIDGLASWTNSHLF